MTSTTNKNSKNNKNNKNNKNSTGTLMIIGGHEDKEDDRLILQKVAELTNRGGGRLVLMTVATQLPKEVTDDYLPVFASLGIKQVDVLDVRTRLDAQDAARLELLKQADTVFFTGGDQLRITSQIGNTPVFDALEALYAKGGLIVGTSAGAAAMSETMLVAGSSDKSPSVFGPDMATGLGFVKNIVIDSHFAERGRVGRLLGAVALNPRNIGVGIDEDTAIVMESPDSFSVLGSGAVYVVDGSTISYSNLAEQDRGGTLSVTGATLHLLSSGDAFDLHEGRPVPGGATASARVKDSEKH